MIVVVVVIVTTLAVDEVIKTPIHRAGIYVGTFLIAIVVLGNAYTEEELTARQVEYADGIEMIKAEGEMRALQFELRKAEQEREIELYEMRVEAGMEDCE